MMIDNETSRSTNQLSTHLRGYVFLLVFLTFVGTIGVTAPVLSSGNSLVWRYDGLQQEVLSLAYIGKELRRCARLLLAGEPASLNMFIFGCGYGMDFTALSGPMDPLSWFSAFVPSRYAEFLHYFLTYCRVALSAITFFFYCVYKGNDKDHAFVASLCYAFSGYSVFWGILRHPNFLNVLYIFPLVLIGVEKLYEESKPLCFVLALSYQFFLSPYFAFMTSIAVFVYCVIKFLTTGRPTLITFVSLVIKFLACGLLALCISMVGSLPVILDITSGSRLDVETAIQPLYGISYYAHYLTNLIGGEQSLTGSIIYVGPIVLVSLLLFIVNNNKEGINRRGWTLGLIAVVVASIFPVFGSLFNAFHYVTDRWLFILDFVLSYLCCVMLPSFFQLTSRSRTKLLLLVCGISLLVPASLLYEGRPIPVLVSEALLISSTVYLCSLSKEKPGPSSFIALSLIVLSCAFVASFAVCASWPVGAGFAKEFFTGIGTVHDFYTEQNPYKAILSIPEEEQQNYRYSFPYHEPYRLNESLLHKGCGISHYSSYYNQAIQDFRNEMGMADVSFSATYSGNNSRLALDAFSGSKYFFIDDGEEWLLPATYTDTGIEANNQHLYSTEYALPPAVLYDKTIDRADYETLGMVERQQAILSGCVLEDVGDADQLLDVNGISSAATISFDVSCEDGVIYNDNSFVVSERGKTATVSFEGLSDSETYLCFENLNYRDSFADNQPQTSRLAYALFAQKPANSFTINMTTSSGSRTISAYTPYDFRYCGKTDWAMNFGYCNDPVKRIELTFPKEGTYTFEDMSVVCQPIEPIKSSLSALRDKGLMDIEKSSNTIRAVATLDNEHATALFTIGYSSGWKATVDGEPTKVLRGNTGFLAVPLDGVGAHEIILTYRTPGLFAGAILSAVGMLLFLIGSKALSRHTDTAKHSATRKR